MTTTHPGTKTAQSTVAITITGPLPKKDQLPEIEDFVSQALTRLIDPDALKTEGTTTVTETVTETHTVTHTVLVETVDDVIELG